MSGADWLALLWHFLSLSLLAVGGAIATAPEMHRYLVGQRHWLTGDEFSAAIALAQAAPGPNVLFVALLGWQVGVNAAGGVAGGAASDWPAWGLGLAGASLAMLGMLLPSGLLTYSATRWAQRRQDWRGVRAFKAGMAPVVVGLIFSTGWLLLGAYREPARDWRLWLLAAVSALLVWGTRVHLLWLMGAGAVLGAMAWV